MTKGNLVCTDVNALCALVRLKIGPAAFKSTVPYQVRTLSQVGTSSYMAYALQELTQGVPIRLKKFLLGPIVKLNSLCSFQGSCLLINLGTCIRVRIRFRYQRCDICVDLHMIYMLRMAVLNRTGGWFYYVLKR